MIQTLYLVIAMKKQHTHTGRKRRNVTVRRYSGRPMAAPTREQRQVIICEPVKGAPADSGAVRGEEEKQRNEPHGEFSNRRGRYGTCSDDGEPLVAHVSRAE